MSLPPIPDAAIYAAAEHLPLSRAKAFVEAAWPDLYAAALRDVADRIDDTHALDGGRGWDTNTDTIRAYADEALASSNDD